MIIALHNGQFLATSIAEAKERFEGGKFREATLEENALALRSISLNEISAQPQAYQNLAIAIARLHAYVGKLAKPLVP